MKDNKDKMSKTPAYRSKLDEGLENGDLQRLVKTKLHIDEFKSKLGEDQDICVLSFKIGDKAAANDLVNFIEKGYEWVLDADASTGELDDGDYMVFVEVERNTSLPDEIIELVTDMVNLTHDPIEDWAFWYYKDKSEYPLEVQNLQRMIPLTPEEYRKHFGESKPEESAEETNESIQRRAELNSLRAAAGVPVGKSPDKDSTDQIKIWAGIK